MKLDDFLYKVKPSHLDSDEIKRVATDMGWITPFAGPLISSVERDLVTFDSFAVVAELSEGKLQFGGGTLLNWVYARTSPRFSFDVDSQILDGGYSKKRILTEVIARLNSKLRTIGKIVRIPYEDIIVEVGTIEYDK